MLWCFLPPSVIDALLCYWSGRMKENSLSGNLHLHGVRLSLACSPFPFTGTVNSLRFFRVCSAGRSAPKQHFLRPLTVLLPSLLAVAPCQTHPLPSVSFGSAGSEYLGAPRWL